MWTPTYPTSPGPTVQQCWLSVAPPGSKAQAPANSLQGVRESVVLGLALAAEALGCCGLRVISLLHVPPKERPGDTPGWKGAPTGGAFSNLSRGPHTS